MINLREFKTPIRLKNIGKEPVPRQLYNGKLFKISPGIFHNYGVTVKHPFDADGVLSCFTFYNGYVDYSARIVNTEHRIREKHANKRLYSGYFGTPPFLQPFKNAANTSVIYWNHKLIVFYEGGIPYTIDPDTLETIGPYKPTPNIFKEGFPLRSNILPSGVISCAHPKIYKDRLIIFLPTYEWNGQWWTEFKFIEIDNKDTIVLERTIKLPGFVYIHDFVVTDTEYIFFESSFDLNFSEFFKTNNFIDTLQFKDNNIYLHRISRKVNSLSICELDMKGFIFHNSSVINNCIYSSIYPKFVFPSSTYMQYGQLLETNLNNLTSDIIFSEYYCEFPTVINNNLIVNVGKTNPLEEVINITTQKSYKLYNNNQFEVNSDGTYLLWLENNINKTFLNIAVIEDPSNILCKFVLPDFIPLSLHGTWIN